MEVNKDIKNTPVIMEWLGEEQGDNLAIKSGLRVFTVDKHGTMISQRYKRAQARPLTSNIAFYEIDGISDLKVGETYSISQSEVVIGKLLESNLFGYRFLSVTPQGDVTFTDIDYAEAIVHFQSGNIKRIRSIVCED